MDDSNNKLKNILIIEDDEDYAFLEKEILEDELAVSVSVVAERHQLAPLRFELFDLIMLDFNLPDTTGIEVLKLIRRSCDVPVILVTGQNEIKIAIETLKNGANDYLIKSPELIPMLPVAVTKVYESYLQKKIIAKQENETQLMAARVETLSQTLTTLAHYINNSTTTIFGYAQLCQQFPESNDKSQKLANISIKETQRITLVLQALEKLVNSMDMRTTNYVNIPNAMFEIEEEIKERLSEIVQAS